jgi:hypothetical protein
MSIENEILLNKRKSVSQRKRKDNGQACCESFVHCYNEKFIVNSEQQENEQFSVKWFFKLFSGFNFRFSFRTVEQKASQLRAWILHPKAVKVTLQKKILKKRVLTRKCPG